MRSADDLAKAQLSNQLVEIQRLNQAFATREQDMRNVHAAEIDRLAVELTRRELVIQRQEENERTNESRRVELELRLSKLANERNELQQSVNALHGQLSSLQYAALDTKSLVDQERRRQAAEIAGFKDELNTAEIMAASLRHQLSEMRAADDLATAQLANQLVEIQRLNQEFASREQDLCKVHAAELAELNRKIEDTEHRRKSEGDANSQAIRAQAVEVIRAAETNAKLGRELAETRAKTERLSDLMTTAQTSVTEQSSRNDRELTSIRGQLDAAKRQLTARFQQLVWLAHLFDKTTHSFSVALNDVANTQTGRLLGPLGGVLRIDPLLEQSPSAFIEAIYDAFLGRQPDSAGKDAYLTSLAEGKSKIEVLLEIAFSNEARSVRQVSNAANWQVVLADNLDQLLSFDGDEFLCSAYQSLLGRDPDEIGYNVYMKTLARGSPKISVVLAIAQSEEGERHRDRLKHCDHLIPIVSSTDELMRLDDRRFVRAAYLTILGREPGKSGLANYQRSAGRRRAREKLLARLAQSDEALSPSFGSKIVSALAATPAARGSLLETVRLVLLGGLTSDPTSSALQEARETANRLTHMQLRLLSERVLSSEKLTSTEARLKELLREGNKAIRDGVKERNQLQLRVTPDALQVGDFVSLDVVTENALPASIKEVNSETLSSRIPTSSRALASVREMLRLGAADS